VPRPSKILEGESEDESDDAGEDDVERPADRDPTENTAGESGEHRRQHDACRERQSGTITEESRAVTTDPGEGAHAEEQLTRASEDDVEGDCITGKHEAPDGQPHHQPGIAQPDGHHSQDRPDCGHGEEESGK
jgi:hypothetical protein